MFYRSCPSHKLIIDQFLKRIEEISNISKPALKNSKINVKISQISTKTFLCSYPSLQLININLIATSEFHNFRFFKQVFLSFYWLANYGKFRFFLVKSDFSTQISVLKFSLIFAVLPRSPCQDAAVTRFVGSNGD